MNVPKNGRPRPAPVRGLSPEEIEARSQAEAMRIITTTALAFVGPLSRWLPMDRLLALVYAIKAVHQNGAKIRAQDADPVRAAIADHLTATLGTVFAEESVHNALRVAADPASDNPIPQCLGDGIVRAALGTALDGPANPALAFTVLASIAGYIARAAAPEALEVMRARMAALPDGEAIVRETEEAGALAAKIEAHLVKGAGELQAVAMRSAPLVQLAGG